MLASFFFALKSLRSHKLRTILTVLAVSIGIAAVIVVISAGEGLQSLLNSQLETFGSNLIQIEVKIPSAKKNSQSNAMGMVSGITITTLKDSDREAILKNIANISDAYSAVLGQEQIVYGENRKKTMIFGASASIFNVDNAEIDLGRAYSQYEEKGLAQAAVLGSDIKEKIFGESNPIGKTIKIKQKQFKVIGTLKKRGTITFFNFDDLVYIPLKTFQKQIAGIDHVSAISVKGSQGSNLAYTARRIEELLRERHEISNSGKDDFSVTTMEEAKEMLGTVTGAVKILLLALSGISLAVGGIGIMNVMYVNVKERTFEIGLRKALGARYEDILIQFLWEAILISLFGAAAGVSFGIIASFLAFYAASLKGFLWEFSVPLSSVIISIAFSAGIGTVFGYLPAKNAAKKDAIKSLASQ